MNTVRLKRYCYIKSELASTVSDICLFFETQLSGAITFLIRSPQQSIVRKKCNCLQSTDKELVREPYLACNGSRS